MKRLVDRKLLAKAVGYRLFITLFDLGIVSVSFQLSGSIVTSILVLNLLKLTGYYAYDMWYYYGKKPIINWLAYKIHRLHKVIYTHILCLVDEPNRKKKMDRRRNSKTS